MSIFLSISTQSTYLCKKIWKKSFSVVCVNSILRNFDRFGQKIGTFQKMTIFWSFLVIDFDPVNRFSWFKNQDTPNFKGFLMVYILFTISNFLVWDKTGFHLAPFRGDPSTLYRSILSNWKYFWKLEKICYIPSNFHKFCFIPWYFFI